MANQCASVEEQGHLDDMPFTTVSLLAPTETLRATEAYFTARGEVVFESGVVSDSPDVRFSAAVVETLIGRGLAIPSSAVDEVVQEIGRVADRATSTRSQAVAESARAADSMRISWRKLVAEHLLAHEVLSPSRQVVLNVTETGRLADLFAGRRGSTVVETLSASERFYFRREWTVTEHATVVDLADAGGNADALLAEAGRLADGAVLLARASVVVAELGVLEDMAIPPSLGTAWTANTDSWAASRYVGYTMNSLAVIDGVLYGASEQGLHRIGGADDAGAPIDAWIVTGQQPLRGDSVNRGGYIYSRMATAGSMRVKVSFVQAGARGSYEYPFEPRPNNDIAPMRAKVGKGIRSLMWQFEVGNADGAAFNINNGLGWFNDAGSRRV